MIGRLEGRLAEKSPAQIVVDVGGVGYQAMIPLSTFYRLPEEGARVRVEVVTNLREGALELFAFSQSREKALFALLRSVSGVGPRLALAVLSGIEPDEFERVVSEADIARLTRIPGVGRKTAERVVVELKDRLKKGPAAKAPEADEMSEDAVLALVALGYKRAAASTAVRACRGDAGVDVAGLIKRSLARLAAST